VRGGGDRSEVLEVFRWRLVDTWELAYPYVQMRRVEQPGLWSALDDLYVDAYEAVYAGPKPGRHEPATRERALRPLDRAVSPEEVPEGPADMTALTGRPTPHGAPVAAAPEREPPRAEPAAASPTPVPAAPPVAAPATPTPAVEPAATTPAAPPADDVPAGPPERSTKRAAPSPIVGRRLLLDARSGGFSVDIASEAPPVRNRLIDLRGALSDVDPAPPADVDPRPAASPRPPGAAQAFEEVIDVDPRPSPTGYPPGS
jgi:hypothetical protein